MQVARSQVVDILAQALGAFPQRRTHPSCAMNNPTAYGKGKGGVNIGSGRDILVRNVRARTSSSIMSRRSTQPLCWISVWYSTQRRPLRRSDRQSTRLKPAPIHITRSPLRSTDTFPSHDAWLRPCVPLPTITCGALVAAAKPLRRVFTIDMYMKGKVLGQERCQSSTVRGCALS